MVVTLLGQRKGLAPAKDHDGIALGVLEKAGIRTNQRGNISEHAFVWDPVPDLRCKH